MSNTFQQIPIPDGVLLDQLESRSSPETNWIWRGYLARGSVTLLTSIGKTGKTTLLAALLSRLRVGGSFAGQDLVAGRAAVVSEEPLQLWQERNEHLDLGKHVYFFCRPYSDAASMPLWHSLIEKLIRLNEKERLDLIVIDPLAEFLPPWSENLATILLQALKPLHRLANAGSAIVLLHHPRKGHPPIGQAARGSGALVGFVDISLEMKCRDQAKIHDRRRRLLGFSRYQATPRDVMLELNAAGTEYLCHGAPDDDEFHHIWPILQELLTKAERKLTRRELLERWPRPENKPNEVTLWRWLERGVEQTLLLKDAGIRRTEPFRYWLAGRTVERVSLLDSLPPLPLEEERLR
ncbi:MAG TPA: AAA family ATPase [Gemmataceae bacterium]|nr:AAA family ATPase [Gemmataceae bacterium]